MSVEVKGVKSLRQVIAELSNLVRKGPGKKFMSDVGKDIIKTIKDRSSRGQDVQGNSFRTLEGDGFESQATSTLNRSGQMLGALSEQSGNKDTRVFVKSSSRKGQRINNFQLAEVHNLGLRSGRGIGFKMPQREFMGLTNQEIDQIVKEMIKDYDKILIKILKGGGIRVLR